MSSDTLKKYLAYYQKTLRDDPENIEARLRLAALFREMGNISHAIEEYVTASKLLATQGLPLEAIAACKAVLELEPTHTEVQLFLARLFAQAPDAAGKNARIARPVDSDPSLTRRPQTPVSLPALSAPPRTIAPLSTSEVRAFERSGASPITLAQPKDTLRDGLDADSEPEDDLPTGVHHSIAAEGISFGDDDSSQPPSIKDLLESRAAPPAALVPLTDDATLMIPLNEQTNMLEQPSFAASPAAIARARAEVTEELRETVEFSYLEDLRSTQAIDPEDILESLAEQEEQLPPTLPEAPAEVPRSTLVLRPIARTPNPTGKWHPQDRDLFEAEEEEGLGAMTEPLLEEITKDRQQTHEEAFDVDVFSMEGVNLSTSGADSLLEELSEGFKQRLDAFDSEPILTTNTTRVSIRREELPEIPLFSGVNQRAFLRFLNEVKASEFEAGECILAPNERNKSIYIIARGKAQASKQSGGQDLFLAEFSEGDFFGEFELLTGHTGSARVVASTHTIVLEVSEASLNAIAEEDPEIWESLWEVYCLRMLNNLMASHAIFRHLPMAVRDEVLGLFEMREHVVDSVVILPDQPCQFVCLVLFGELSLVPEDESLPSKVLREGEFFGFVASLSDEPCRATIMASADATLLCLSAAKFRSLTRQYAGIAGEIRAMLRARVTRNDLFLTGITHYGETGINK